MKGTQFSLKRFPIKTKFIVVYSLLIIIFVASLSTISYMRFVKIVRDQSINYALGVLEQIRNNVDSTIEKIDLASYIIFSNPDILKILKYQSPLPAIDSWEKYSIERLMTEVMFSRGRRGGDISSITLYDNQGNHITTNPTIPHITFPEMTKEADREDGRFAWLELYGRYDVIPLVRRIYDMEMNPVGYLRFDIRVRPIREMLSNEMVKQGSEIYIFKEDKLILSGSKNREVKLDIETLDFSSMNREGYFSKRIDGQKNIVVFYTSRLSGWNYVGIIPLYKMTEPARGIRNTTIISSLVTIGLFMVISFFIVNQFTGPIHQIADQMKQVRIKDWAPQLKYQGNDEIAYLTEQFNIMVTRINSLVNQVIEERDRYNRQELNALQSQINPHFLYNTLDIVNWMARERDIPEIGAIVKSLSDIMRYSISHKREIVTVEDELEHVKKYLHLQSVRFGDKFCVSYNVANDVLDYGIPRLTLQPIVENSIMHAFKGLKRMGEIQIESEMNDHILLLKVQDNGVGMDQQQLSSVLQEKNWAHEENHTGLGVSNVDRRMKLIYGEQFGLAYESEIARGTTCFIRLPIT